MELKKMAMEIGQLLEEKKASEISIIDIGEKSGFADYMIIASGGSERQVATLKEEVEKLVEQSGGEVKRVEGKKESGWILLDCGDIIVNLFTVDMREKYTVEKVWGDCETILLEERNV